MKYIFFLFLVCTMAACASSEQTVQEAIDEIRENYDTETDNVFDSGQSLASFRTQLADAYAYRENEIPEVFNRIRVEQKQEKNLYEGYRIQIYSGQDVSNADNIAEEFKIWADTSIANYQPEAYVLFRTPFYRVHVGDFYKRDRAIKFSNIVKRYFKDAWVVYDRVTPRSVPADTADIRSK